MNGKRMSRGVSLGLALLILGPAITLAATPWDKLLSFNRVDADPEKSYQLAEDNGPWMIMACSFSGNGADEQAKQLVLELRKRYKLPAYVHQMKFELNNAVGRGCDRYGAPVKMKYQRGSEIKEIAVLVGNYSSVDDREAQDTLKRMKTMQPECLDLKDGKKTNATLAGFRMLQQQVLAASGQKPNRGPMGHAFITANPMLPPGYLAPKGLDTFVLKLNEGIEHSLLKCPRKYTVQVAHFTGKVIIDQNEIRDISTGAKKMESKLDEAAEKAHRLTIALRKQGKEAYEFHDRYASIVTIGSFDSVGTPRSDGKTEINPAVHEIMKSYGAVPTNLPGQPAGSMQPKIIDGIVLDIQPLPVEVPRRSLAAELSRNTPLRHETHTR